MSARLQNHSQHHFEPKERHLFCDAGIALYYSDMLYGAPPVLENHVLRFPALHDVNIVLTNRTVPVPHVGQHERFLVKQLHIPGFFHVVARLASLRPVGSL